MLALIFCHCVSTVFLVLSRKIYAAYEYDDFLDHDRGGNFGGLARELALFTEWLASALSARDGRGSDGVHGDHGIRRISRGGFWQDGGQPIAARHDCGRTQGIGGSTKIFGSERSC
jgi:hypothetical protein